MVLRVLEHGVQPLSQANERSNTLDGHRNGPSVAAAGNCLNGDAEPLAGLGRALASVADSTALGLEATVGERSQNRHDTLRVMSGSPARNRSRARCIFVDREWSLTPRICFPPSTPRLERLSARAAGSTIDDHDA
jgi:hypothetical protein